MKDLKVEAWLQLVIRLLSGMIWSHSTHLEALLPVLNTIKSERGNVQLISDQLSVTTLFVQSDSYRELIADLNGALSRVQEANMKPEEFDFWYHGTKGHIDALIHNPLASA